ncbi:MAG TPA: peptidylprolyl isomerase [Tahibacter sp.]|uniref:peptidylprolyl isomerase n=1 Tax=Tahibacter sp. TaxID=2056211 RepID=UPI002B5FB3BD|nr:peptidylprolyl isomerase [Tahibacter sp.]HSX60711.1 peptidylprolyl isomerase [Tahibacter sp.]
MRRVLPLLLLASLAGCSGGSGGKPPVIQYAGGEPVLRVNDQPVPAALLDEVARGRGLDLADPEQRQRAIKELSDYVLLANVARKQGMEDDVNFAATVEAQRLQGVANATMAFYARANPITEQMLKAEYETQVAKAGSESYDFSQLLFDNEAEALKVGEELLGGKDWTAVYAEWQGKAKQAREFKDVRLVQLPAQELVDAIKQLKPGASTKVPVKSQYGWHLLHLVSTKPVTPPAFDAVRAELHKRMVARQGEQWMQKMRGEAVIVDLKAPKGAEPAAAAKP